MTTYVIKSSFILLIFVSITCSLTHAQMKKSSGTHEQYEQSNESEGIGKDNSRLQTIEGKVKQPSPKVVFLLKLQIINENRYNLAFLP